MFRNFAHDPAAPTGRYSWEIHGLDLSIVNGLRRVILTDIPTLGFSGEEEPSVVIHENTGPLHNEIMCHRIGLIPIHFSEEETDGFTPDTWRFEMGLPKNTTDNTVDIHADKAFKVFKDDKEMPAAETERLFPKNRLTKEGILITRLRPGETLRATATPVKKTARFHASFCPVSLCTLSFMVDPAEAARKTDLLEKERAYMRNEWGDPVAVKFELEPEMALGPKYLVHKALEILIEKVSAIPREIATDASQKVKVELAQTYGVEFVFQDEDDTLGNILQAFLHQKYLREKHSAPGGDTVSFAGYFCPHPLDPTMVLRICLSADVPRHDDDNRMVASVAPYVELLSDACRSITMRLQEVQNEWLRFCP